MALFKNIVLSLLGDFFLYCPGSHPARDDPKHPLHGHNAARDSLKKGSNAKLTALHRPLELKGIVMCSDHTSPPPLQSVDRFPFQNHGSAQVGLIVLEVAVFELFPRNTTPQPVYTATA